MRSTFSGLELARRALESQQTALDTTGHNIANANTPGYTRQVVNLQQTVPSSIPGMGHNISIGTGVTVQSIERARDIFVDRQFRWETSKGEYWTAREDILLKVEGLLNEPKENSLSTDLDKFWNAWSGLSKDPENLGARAVVLERAATLADTFHHIYQQITEMQKGLDSSVRVQINQINVYAKQIQDLNLQIKRAEVAGDNPNDLKDKRDALVDNLSKITNVRVVESRDSTFKDREVNVFKLYIGNENTTNQILVNDTTAYQLEEPSPAGANGLPFAQVKWGAGHPLAGQEVDLGDRLGQLQANLRMRGNDYDLDPNNDNVAEDNKGNAYLAYLRNQYDELARGIAIAVNAIHKTGIAKGLAAGDPVPDFFDTTVGNITAGNIRVNSVLNDDPWKIATGKNTFGDGEIAKAISTLSSGWTGLSSVSLTKADGKMLIINPTNGDLTSDSTIGRTVVWATNVAITDPDNGQYIFIDPMTGDATANSTTGRLIRWASGTDTPLTDPDTGDPILLDPATGDVTTDTAIGKPVTWAALTDPDTGDLILIDPNTGELTTDPAVGKPVAWTPAAPLSAASFGDYYGAAVAELGVDVQQATRMREGQEVLVTHMLNQRESFSGVSLDEEMTNLVRFQKSYSAAARIVTMLDDMLNTIVNGMGITR